MPNGLYTFLAKPPPHPIFGSVINLPSFGLQKAHGSRCWNAVHAGGRADGWLRRRELPRQGEHGWRLGLSQWISWGFERTLGRPRDRGGAEAGGHATVWKLESRDPVTKIYISKTHSSFAICSLKCSWKWVTEGAQLVLFSYLFDKVIPVNLSDLALHIGLLSISWAGFVVTLLMHLLLECFFLCFLLLG